MTKWVSDTQESKSSGTKVYLPKWNTTLYIEREGTMGERDRYFSFCCLLLHLNTALLTWHKSFFTPPTLKSIGEPWIEDPDESICALRVKRVKRKENSNGNITDVLQTCIHFSRENIDSKKCAHSSLIWLEAIRFLGTLIFKSIAMLFFLVNLHYF